MTKGVPCWTWKDNGLIWTALRLEAIFFVPIVHTIFGLTGSVAAVCLSLFSVLARYFWKWQPVKKAPFLWFIFTLWILQMLCVCILFDTRHPSAQGSVLFTWKRDPYATNGGGDPSRLRGGTSREVIQDNIVHLQIADALVDNWDSLAWPASNQSGLERARSVDPHVHGGVSVILTAFNEHQYLQKTVDSILAQSPAAVLTEVLVVDDFSDPPLTSSLNNDTLHHPLVRVVRNHERKGLIKSKKFGGDEARGEFLIFLDAHVKPFEHWLIYMLRDELANANRIVVPSIPILNGDTWEQDGKAVGHKMMFSWDMAFNWVEDDNDEVPCMSGGLLGMSKKLWTESGGLDHNMDLWGSENIEQSVRVWMSGGEILVNRQSLVAHVFRPKFPYDIDETLIRLNKIRTIETWFDHWKEKFYAHSPARLAKQSPVNNQIEERRDFRAKIGIRDFNWYVKRFREMFVQKKLINAISFHIQSPAQDGISALCMALASEVDKSMGATLTETERNDLYKVPPHSLVMAPCSHLNETAIRWTVWGSEQPINQMPTEAVAGKTVSYNPRFHPMSAVGPRHDLMLRHVLSEKCLSEIPNLLDPTMTVQSCIRPGEKKRSTQVLTGFFWSRDDLPEAYTLTDLELLLHDGIINSPKVDLSEHEVRLHSKPSTIRWGSQCLDRINAVSSTTRFQIVNQTFCDPNSRTQTFSISNLRLIPV